MEDASAASAVKNFGYVLNRIEAQKRLSMTYDQGEEMAGHQQLAAETGIKVYTLLTRIVLGNVAATRAPTDWRDSTCQRGAT